MLLSPFVDLGVSIDRCMGMPNVSSELPVTTAAKQPVHPKPPAAPTRPRIIASTGSIQLSHEDLTTRIQGTGIAICSGPLDQSKAYFEITADSDICLIAVGAVGKHPSSIVAEGTCHLAEIPNSIHTLLSEISKADVVGVVVNIADFPPCVTVYLNDKEINRVSCTVRGDLWPAFEMITGNVSIVFDRHSLKHLDSSVFAGRGVEPLMLARNIL